MKHLVNKKGYKYTQVADVDITARVLAAEIYLSDEKDEKNWKLITDKAAEKYRNEQQIAVARMIEEKNKNK